jgi:hypothetical protein
MSEGEEMSKIRFLLSLLLLFISLADAGLPPWELVHRGSEGLSPFKKQKNTAASPVPAHRYSHSAQTIDHYMVISHGYFYDSVHHKPAWLDDTWKFDYIREEWSEVQVTGNSANTL